MKLCVIVGLKVAVMLWVLLKGGVIEGVRLAVGVALALGLADTDSEGLGLLVADWLALGEAVTLEL